MKIWRVLTGLTLALTLIVGASSTSPTQASPKESLEVTTPASKASAAATPAGYFYLPEGVWYMVQISPFCTEYYLHGRYGSNAFVQGYTPSIAQNADGSGSCLGSSAIQLTAWGWQSQMCSWGDELWYPPGLSYCTYSGGVLQVTGYGRAAGLLGGTLRYMANILPFTAYYVSFSPIQ